MSKSESDSGAAPRDGLKAAGEDLKTRLTPEQYHVTQEHGTERPFTGPWLDNKQAGAYRCVCCGSELFDASTKFESGSGWPSFSQPASGVAVTELADSSLFMRRVEVRCAKCAAHLGHVFPDGPTPTGLRYCINGCALDFEEKSK
jgi:peptide-methionine (R)-S-oxide reductase